MFAREHEDLHSQIKYKINITLAVNPQVSGHQLAKSLRLDRNYHATQVCTIGNSPQGFPIFLSTNLHTPLSGLSLATSVILILASGHVPVQLTYLSTHNGQIIVLLLLVSLKFVNVKH